MNWEVIIICDVMRVNPASSPNVCNFNEDRSDYVILDAENLSSGPLATIALPHRVPFTPHGNWRNA